MIEIIQSVSVCEDYKHDIPRITIRKEKIQFNKSAQLSLGLIKGLSEYVGFAYDDVKKKFLVFSGGEYRFKFYNQGNDKVIIKLHDIVLVKNIRRLLCTSSESLDFTFGFKGKSIKGVDMHYLNSFVKGLSKANYNRTSIILNDAVWFESITSAANRYSISIKSITDNLKGKTKKVRGVGTFKYV